MKNLTSQLNHQILTIVWVVLFNSTTHTLIHAMQQRRTSSIANQTPTGSTSPSTTTPQTSNLTTEQQTNIENKNNDQTPPAPNQEVQVPPGSTVQLYFQSNKKEKEKGWLDKSLMAAKTLGFLGAAATTGFVLYHAIEGQEGSQGPGPYEMYQQSQMGQELDSDTDLTDEYGNYLGPQTDFLESTGGEAEIPSGVNDPFFVKVAYFDPDTKPNKLPLHSVHFNRPYHLGKEDIQNAPEQKKHEISAHDYIVTYQTLQQKEYALANEFQDARTDGERESIREELMDTERTRAEIQAKIAEQYPEALDSILAQIPHKKPTPEPTPTPGPIQEPIPTPTPSKPNKQEPITEPPISPESETKKPSNQPTPPSPELPSWVLELISTPASEQPTGPSEPKKSAEQEQIPNPTPEQNSSPEGPTAPPAPDLPPWISKPSPSENPPQKPIQEPITPAPSQPSQEPNTPERPHFRDLQTITQELLEQKQATLGRELSVKEKIALIDEARTLYNRQGAKS